MTVLRSVRRAGGRALDAMAARSAAAAELRSYVRFLRSERKEPLLVYQMGKVGSSTLVASLYANPQVIARHSIYPVHRLTASGLDFVERVSAEARARLRGTANPQRRFHPQHARTGRWLQERLTDPRNKRKWLVITLVREPIARNVSSFFQNLEFRLSYDYRSRLQSGGKDAVAADVRKLFDDNYLTDEAIERVDANPLTWFDNELKSVFGVDVYASEFPTRKGYRIYDTDRARVLLLRLEDLNRTHAVALKEFLQIDDFRLVNANTADEKAYAELYESFRRDLVLPAEYVDRLCASRHTRHFYTEAEIQSVRGKWKTRERSHAS
jgi:hypothetical protein